jgi:hypothetical protein
VVCPLWKTFFSLRRTPFYIHNNRNPCTQCATLDSPIHQHHFHAFCHASLTLALLLATGGLRLAASCSTTENWPHDSQGPAKREIHSKPHLSSSCLTTTIGQNSFVRLRQGRQSLFALPMLMPCGASRLFRGFAMTLVDVSHANDLSVLVLVGHWAEALTALASFVLQLRSSAHQILVILRGTVSHIVQLPHSSYSRTSSHPKHITRFTKTVVCHQQGFSFRCLEGEAIAS